MAKTKKKTVFHVDAKGRISTPFNIDDDTWFYAQKGYFDLVAWRLGKFYSIKVPMHLIKKALKLSGVKL